MIIVAFLQFRWTSQITEATEAQIGNRVQSLMSDWHRDLYQEFSAICVALQVGPDSGARDGWKDYLQRYAEWVGTPANREMVENIYIWEVSQRAEPQLLRLDVDSDNIERWDVPRNLESLLARLQANSSSLGDALSAWEFRDSASQGRLEGGNNLPPRHAMPENALLGWQFDANIPAIVHPIVHHARPVDSHSTIMSGAVDWIVVVPNLSTVQNRILPDLAERYFGGGGGLEYNLAVIVPGSLPPRLIYASDAEFGAASVGAAEATMNIFRPAPGNMGGQFKQTATGGNSLKSAEWHNFSGPVWFPTIQYSPSQDPWVLVLQHRNGPLQAVVNRVRQRNLTISALVLLLLGATMGFVAVAGLRAQNFARLQMEFVASVSHELRTPLTAIFSAGENIKDGFVKGQSNMAHYGSIVTSQARQLVDLVDRILLFASIRSGKIHYNLRPLQVSAILQRIRKTTAGLIEDSTYSIEEHVEPDLPCVAGDLSAVCGCLENLITNALKYSGSDGRIRISAAAHETGHDEKEIRISVQDFGMGISSSDLPHIFEPFYRSPAVTTAQIRGTGLGLSLAKHLAEAMGGRVTVVSEVGLGSVFTLHLPASAEQEYELSPAGSNGDAVRRNE
ncbi:MAG: HAMP domain-containing sensor histidine kinase [Candidatus Acidiferrum sp.]